VPPLPHRAGGGPVTPDLLAVCERTDPATLRTVTAYLRSFGSLPGVDSPWFAGVRFAIADMLDGWTTDPGHGPSRMTLGQAFGPWSLGEGPGVRQAASAAFSAAADSWRGTNPQAADIWSALAREVVA